MTESSDSKTLRVFETVFIGPPQLTETEFGTVVAEVEGHFRDNGANIRRKETWGRKRLAYPIAKHSEGWYALLQLEGPGTAIAEVERRMRIHEKVIRYQTVRLDDVVGALEAADQRVERIAREAEERAQREADRALREAERAKVEADRVASAIEDDEADSVGEEE